MLQANWRNEIHVELMLNNSKYFENLIVQLSKVFTLYWASIPQNCEIFILLLNQKILSEEEFAAELQNFFIFQFILFYYTNKAKHNERSVTISHHDDVKRRCNLWRIRASATNLFPQSSKP